MFANPVLPLVGYGTLGLTLLVSSLLAAPPHAAVFIGLLTAFEAAAACWSWCPAEFAVSLGG